MCSFFMLFISKVILTIPSIIFINHINHFVFLLKKNWYNKTQQVSFMVRVRVIARHKGIAGVISSRPRFTTVPFQHGTDQETIVIVDNLVYKPFFM